MTNSVATQYPTASSVATEIKSFISLNATVVSDWDAFVYEYISRYDEQFRNDPEWYDEDDCDIKDELRDEVLDLMGLA